MDSFFIRRNAYSRAAVLENEITGHREHEANAFWCAVTYIHGLVNVILRRKAMVDEAVKAQRAAMGTMPDGAGSASDAAFWPATRQRVTRLIIARLVGALSGEVYTLKYMSNWSLVGDAIAKANADLDIQRRAVHGHGRVETDDGHVETWIYQPADEANSRTRFKVLLAPGEQMIDVKVVKMNLADTMLRGRPSEHPTRPLKVLKQ